MGEKPRVPVVGEFVRGNGVLKKIETLAPPPPPPPRAKTFYVFEFITALCQLRVNDEVLNESSPHWDFFGWGKSLEEAVYTMTEKKKTLRLSAKSDIELVVVKVVSYEVLFRDPSAAPALYAPEFVKFGNEESAATAAEYRRCGGRLPEKIETDYWSSNRGFLEKKERSKA